MKGGDMLRTAGYRLILALITLQAHPSYCQYVDPPVIIEGPKATTLYISDGAPYMYASLHCAASGSTPLTYQWRRNGVVMDLPNNGSVTEGNYTCYVTNHFGTAVSNTTVVKRAYLEHFQDDDEEPYEVNEGDRLVMPCNAPSGDPAPLILWTRSDDSPVIPANAAGDAPMLDLQRGIAQDEDGNLVLLRASREHEGEYLCKAKSEVLSTVLLSGRKVVRVIQANATATSSEIQVLNSSRVISALRGEPVNLYCLATGSPLPNVTWTKQEDPTYHSQDPVLPIRQVTFEDEGTYTCSAGVSGPNKTTILHVEAAPHWMIQPSRSVITPDEDATLSCEAGGKPAPNITWMKDGKPKPEYDGMQTIAVRDVAVNGAAVYQCIASNEYGQIITNAAVIKTDVVRSTPSNIQHERIDGTSVKIYWRGIKDPHLVKYKIKYQRLDGNHPVKYRDCGKNNVCKLGNLRRETHYVFTVTAEYDDGQTMESDQQTFATRRTKAPYVPYKPPKLWKILTIASCIVLILGVSVPVVMCVVLCIRDQVNGYDPEEELPTESDAWGPGRPKPKVPKVDPNRPVLRQDEGAARV